MIKKYELLKQLFMKSNYISLLIKIAGTLKTIHKLTLSLEHDKQNQSYCMYYEHLMLL